MSGILEMAMRQEADRRGSPRRRVFKGATLRFNKGYGALECVVRNQSADGALLAFGDSAGVPAAFDIAIGSDAARPAQVRWRGVTEVGIALG
jgi:hypothetical protein